MSATTRSKSAAAQVLVYDRGLSQLLARVARLPSEAGVQVGIFGDAETAKIAAIHEFGSRVPEKAPAKTARKPKSVFKRATRAVRARVRKALRKAGIRSSRRSSRRKNDDAFGQPGQGRPPKRSFLRSTAEKFKTKYAKMAGVAYGKFLDGQWAIDQALIAVGIEAVSDIQATIIKGIDPKLVKSTVMQKQRKGMPRPKTALYATGKLFNAIRILIPGNMGKR